jgi:hypothetical protein
MRCRTLRHFPHYFIHKMSMVLRDAYFSTFFHYSCCDDMRNEEEKSSLLLLHFTVCGLELNVCMLTRIYFWFDSVCWRFVVFFFSPLFLFIFSRLINCSYVGKISFYFILSQNYHLTNSVFLFTSFVCHSIFWNT